MMLIKIITFLITFASIIFWAKGFNLVNIDEKSENDFVRLNNIESNKRNDEQLKFIYQNYSRVHRNLDNRVIYGESSNKCGGTFKSVQTTIQSADYPNEYHSNSYCEYTFKSPFLCKNEFHIQFLDFALESSKDCVKDRLQIGKQEILCGKVIGIMKYKAMDGILKIIFMSDDTVQNTGFNLLVTRLPCTDEESATVFPIYEKSTTRPEVWSGDNGIELTTSFDYDESTTSDLFVGLTKGNSTLVKKKAIFVPTLTLLPPIYKHFEETQNNSKQFSSLGGSNNGYLPPSTDDQSTHTNCFPHGGSQYPSSGFPTHGGSPVFNIYPPFGGPSNGFPTSNGNYPSLNGYFPPTNGYLPPSNGYLPPTNGYVPPTNGYVPPTNEYVPPTNGYLPPTNGYVPPTNGYVPPSNGYFPPSSGYFPQGFGNFPSINGYLPPPSVYPPRNPSQHPSFPPSNYYPNFPTNNPTNANYPPNTIYPPNTNYFPTEYNPTTRPNPNNDPNLQEITPVRTTYTTNEETYPTRDVAQAQLFPSSIPQCCARQFNQQRFYVASSNFPTRNIQNIDCLHYINRNNPSVCRIRIEFKFFFFGNYHPQLGCTDNFIEIDDRRICGCHSGARYISQWGIGSKIIRVRSGAGVAQGVRGFLLDIIQEQCPYRISRSGELPGNSTNLDRSDNSVAVPVVHTATTQTNSSSLTTYYYYATEEQPKKQLETKKEFEERAEGPNARSFFPPGGQQNRCVFSDLHWLQLIADPLWLIKPSCRR